MAKDNKTIGGLGQRTPGQISRGEAASATKKKAGPSYWQRVKKFATRKQLDARPPRTMEERALSISRTAERAIGGVSPAARRRPGGQLDIRKLAGEGKGPALKAQRGTAAAAARRRALSLEEKQRRGIRVTAADVPGTGLPRGRGEGIPEIKRVGDEGLGKFVGRGVKPPPPKKVAKAAVKRKAPAKPKKKVPWYIRAGRAFKEAGQEALQQAQQPGKPTGQYGTKQQAQKAAKKVEKVVVPKKFKPKR